MVIRSVTFQLMAAHHRGRARRQPYTPAPLWEHRREWGILLVGDAKNDACGWKTGPSGHSETESLKGCLAPYIKAQTPPGDAWQETRERGWSDAARRWVP